MPGSTSTSTFSSSSVSKEIEAVVRILSNKFNLNYEEAMQVVLSAMEQPNEVSPTEEATGNSQTASDDNTQEEKAALELKQKELFDFIAGQVNTQITAERILSYKTSKGDTQKTERDVINDIKSILDTNKIVYTEAGSQQSKDFRNVGNIGLNIEIKKTDSNCIYFNDTCPSKSIFYIIFFTGRKTKKHTIPPQSICINGHEMVKDSPWVYEYQLKLEQLKNQYARGHNKKELSGIMSVYPRPTYKADISCFFKKEPIQTEPTQN
jgi:Holliday junction resolvase RusA-like endonuclease